MENCSKILVCDDQLDIRMTVKAALSSLVSNVVLADSAKQCLALFDETFDLVLLDVQLPDGSGLDILKIILKKNPQAKIILMTAYSNINDAVDSMKNGAVNYIQKPFQIPTLQAAVKEHLDNVSSNITSRTEGSELLAPSGVLKNISKKVDKYAKTNSSVMILGESGVGKELIAKSLHQQSSRHAKPFVAINCPALPNNLFESEVFGYKKGAFTGAVSDKKGRLAVAEGGTIFLDEVGDLSPENQVKLLRTIQEREFEALGSNKTTPFNIRFIAATSLPIETLSAGNTFRRDLFYRLNELEIQVPPLRERLDEIEFLVQHFAKEFVEEQGIEAFIVEADGIVALGQYSWPGNIRELRSLVRRAFILRDNDQAISRDLIRSVLPQEKKETALDPSVTSANNKVVDEKSSIENTLIECKFNLSKTAKLLDMSRSTLYRKIKKYKISA